MVGRRAVHRRRRRAHVRPAAEIRGGFDYIETVTAVDPLTVQFDFNEPFSPALLDIGQQIIAPAHIWNEVEDPTKFANEEPVGTGPYTEVTNFQAQSFDLGKNPEYWQPEKQQIEGIRMLAFAGNDGANLAAANGDVDWAPPVHPEHRGGLRREGPRQPVLLVPAHRVDDQLAVQHHQGAVRRPGCSQGAVDGGRSRAGHRDRDAGLHRIPPTAPGSAGSYDTWRDETVVESCTWTNRDLEGAGELLDDAGITLGEDGKRVLPDGTPFAFDFSVGSTSSDWVSVGNVISQNLAELGVTVTVAAKDWGDVVAGYENGTFDSGIVWSDNAPTPYQFYRGVMGTETVKPVGEQTFENYHRFGSPEADALLARVRRGIRRGRAARRRGPAAGALRRGRAGRSRCSPAPSGVRRATSGSPAGPPRTTRTRPSRRARARRFSSSPPSSQSPATEKRSVLLRR